MSSKSRCPNCKNALLQKSERGTRAHIRGPLIFTNGVCMGQCYWCKSLVKLPMTLEKGAGETFVITQP